MGGYTSSPARTLGAVQPNFTGKTGVEVGSSKRKAHSSDSEKQSSNSYLGNLTRIEVNRTFANGELQLANGKTIKVALAVFNSEELKKQPEFNDGTGYYIQIPPGAFYEFPGQQTTPNSRVESSIMYNEDVNEKHQLPSTDAIQIIDMRWKTAITKYKNIRLQPVDSDCNELCTAIEKHLPEHKLVDEGWELNIVVAKKISRVQNDAETALGTLDIRKGDRVPTVLFMCHRVQGSKTKQDVMNVAYSHDAVKETLHIPYKKNDNN